MRDSSFNMMQTMQVLQAKWRAIFIVTMLSMIIALIVVVLIVPPYYRSNAKIISANPALADKSQLFNDQIQSLYSYFGTGDDLDRIMGIATMGSTYQQLVDRFRLDLYYSKDTFPILSRKAILKLKDDLSIQRTEEGQLNIICWMTDKQLAADIVNTLISIVQQKLESIWQTNYSNAAQKIDQSITETELKYQFLLDSAAKVSSIKSILINKHLESLLDQLSRYRKTAATFKIMSETKPPALYVLEPAIPAVKAERPDKIAVVLTAGLVGCLFSILLVLSIYRKQDL